MPRVLAQHPATALLALALLSLAGAGCPAESPRPIGDVCTDDAVCESGLCHFGTCLDPAGDEDRDTLTNGREAALGSNPFAPDTDFDGTPDALEATATDAPDTDGDGLADILESALTDTDGDCLPDEFDPENDAPAAVVDPALLAAAAPRLCATRGVCIAQVASARVECDDLNKPVCIFDAVPDWESFEITCDGLDNDCDGMTDESHPDSDGDLIADCVDSDRDGDDRDDVTDNCPDVFNRAQTDSDSDGLGDACDPPATPQLTRFSPTSPTNATATVVYGLSEPDAIVALFRHETCLEPVATATADREGQWFVDVQIIEGQNIFHVRAENTAGLRSACTAAAESILVDLTPPSPPTSVAATATDWSNPDLIVFALSGLAETGTTVAVHTTTNCSGSPLVTAPVAFDGAWSAPVAVALASSRFHLRAVDAAGNPSICIPAPLLVGSIRLRATIPGRTTLEAPVQFHYPDGTTAGTMVTATDGTLTAPFIAGGGLTVGFAGPSTVYEWVSLLGLSPGADITVTPRRATAEGTGGLETLRDERNGATAIPPTNVRFGFAWPELPTGAQQLVVVSNCGSTAFYVGPGSNTPTSGDMKVAFPCTDTTGAQVTHLTGFLVAIGQWAADGSTAPVLGWRRFDDVQASLALITSVPLVNTWSDDFGLAGMTLVNGPITGNVQVRNEIRIDQAIAVPFSSWQPIFQQLFFVTPDATVDAVVPLPPNERVTLRTEAIRTFLAGLSRIGWLIHRTPLRPPNDLPVHTYSASTQTPIRDVQIASVVTDDGQLLVPTALSWTALTPPFDRADALTWGLYLVNGESNSNLTWTIIARIDAPAAKDARQQLVLPQFQTNFAGSFHLSAASWWYEEFQPTWVAVGELEGFDNYLNACGTVPGTCERAADHTVDAIVCCQDDYGDPR